MKSYLGKDLFEKVRTLVSRSFYKIYSLDDKNWFSIESIEMNYLSCEDDLDYPMIYVELTIGDVVYPNGQTITVEISLSESDDFNVGHITSALERMEDD